MGDVTLVIDADTAKAVRDLVKLVQAQSDLERKTKELGETSKKSSKEAADAAGKASGEYVNYKKHESAALEKTIETRRNAMQAAVSADRKEIESAKAAEVAKVKSAQGAADAWRRYIKREQQDMDNVSREIQKIRERDTAAAKRNAEDFSTSMGGVGGVIESAARGAAGFFAAFASAQTIIEFLGNIRDRMRGIAEESDRTANAMRSVAIQVPKGAEGQKMLQGIALQGATAGLSPEETGTIANTLQSIPGANVQKELAVGGVLRNLNIEGQDIAPIIQAGVVRGIGGERAGDLAVRASELAPFEAKDVAKYLPKTNKFTSLEAGLAAGTTLRSAGVVSDQIPYAVEAAGRALNEDKSPLAKKFKLKGLTESQRIEKISAAADASGDRAAFIRALPEKYKTGEEEGRALQMILSRGNQFAQDEATLKATGTGIAKDRLSEQLLKNPQQADEIQARRARELFKYNEVYGAAGERARATRASQQSAGIQLQKEMPVGVAQGMVDDSGAPNKFGQAWRALQEQGGGSGILGGLRTIAQGGSNFIDIGTNIARQNGILAPAAGGDTQRSKEVGDLIGALNANTEATKANTGATGGGDGGPSIAQRRNR